MKKLTFGLFILLILTTGLAYADHNQHLFEEGNTLYAKEKYEQAIAKYEEILANGYESWELYYNLGNAYYKDGQLGKAILNYERARSLKSDNEDIQFNLEMANLLVADKINEPPQFFLFKIYHDFKHSMSLNTLALIVIIAYFILITLVILYIFIRSRRAQRISFL